MHLRIINPQKIEYLRFCRISALKENPLFDSVTVKIVSIAKAKLVSKATTGLRFE